MTISKKFVFQLFVYLQLLLLSTGSSVQLTFPSSHIQIEDSGITLYFEFDDTTQTLLMGLDMPQILRYYAVGFANKGNSGMHIFDIVTFLFTQNLGTYSVQVLDLYSTRDVRPPTDTSIGGTSDYVLIDSYVGQGRSQVLFKRKYNTGDAFDYQFDPSLTKDNIVINYAWNGISDTGFSYHSHRCGTVISSMYNGFQGVAASYSASFISPELAFAIHGFGLLIGWGILIEIALQFARYRKYSNYYLKIHLYITIFLYIFTAFASALAIYIQSGEKMRDGLTLFHYYLGIVNLVLCTLQVFFGFLFKSKMVKPKATHLLPLLSKFHLISGIIIYVITKVLIATGVYMGYPDCIPYLYVYLALIFVFRVGQEVKHRFYKKLDGKVVLNMKVADSHLESYQKLLDLLNKKTPISEIFENADLKGMKWAILDNRVFDIKKITHPGGNFMLEQINGREIGRFIYGSYGLESIKQTTQHLHTKAVIEIVKNNMIGTIQNNSQLFIENAKPSEENHGKGEWVLESKTQLTPLIVQFNFVSKQYKINAYTDDIRYIGHHMKVSHRSLKKVRLYTLVLSQTESRTRRRELLWDKNYKDPNTIVNSPKDSKSESLPLILKKYDNPKDKTLSSFIHESQLLTDGFIIEGPFGTGLDLTSESTGVHSIFAAGTGILPFIDLFDYLLEGVLDPSSGHNLFKNGFKLHLFASFGQLNDFIGLDICEKLAKACKDKGMDDTFKMVIRAKDAKTNELYTVTSEVFDNAFIEKHGDKGCTRAYVCGPPVFNQQIPSSLQLIGVAKTRIILV